MESKYKKSENWHCDSDNEELPPLVFKDGRLLSQSSDSNNPSDGKRKNLESQVEEKEEKSFKKYTPPHIQN